MAKMSDYYYYSDYWFENHPVGKVYRRFTDHLYASGIDFEKEIRYCVDDHSNKHSDFVEKSGYNPDIIHFEPRSYNNYRDDIFKFTWDLNNHVNNGYNYCKDITQEQKVHVAKMFCVDGWEKEEIYYKFDIGENLPDIPPENGWSGESGDISYHTLPWVDYLTFQHSRVILQFFYNDYIVSLRKEKLLRCC